MRLEGGPVGAGQGDVHKVLPVVEVSEGGGDVHGEVVPLQAVLLGDAHGGWRDGRPGPRNPLHSIDSLRYILLLRLLSESGSPGKV